MHALINRPVYMEQLISFREKQIIKVVTGIRRCGKSIVLSQIREELSQYSDNIIFLNFKDKETESQLPTWKHLVIHISLDRFLSFGSLAEI